MYAYPMAVVASRVPLSTLVITKMKSDEGMAARRVNSRHTVHRDSRRKGRLPTESDRFPMIGDEKNSRQ